MIEPYPEHIMKLNTQDGFDTWFWEMVNEYRTHEMAYEAVERNHTAYFGTRKYENFDSYRKCRDRRLKKNGK